MEYSRRGRDQKDRRDDRFHNRKKFDSEQYYGSERPSYKARTYKYGKEENTDGAKKSVADQKPSEESRLQSLVRRVTSDGDLDKRLSAMESLKQYLANTENYKSVCDHAEEAIYLLRDILSERISRDFKMETVGCLGSIVFIYTSEIRGARFIDWLFPKIVSDDVRLYYLHAVAQALKLDKNADVFRLVIQSTLTKCQYQLENVGTPEHLEGVVKVLILISKLYPMAFKRIFRDMVDILVGWHIDSSQKETVTQFTSSALISLQSFWSADVMFTFNLLSQFLEDMENSIVSIDDKRQNSHDKHSVETTILKVAAFMRAFTTVIKCLGNSSPVENQYLLEVFERLLNCTFRFSTDIFQERTLELGNDCIRTIISKLGSMDCPTQDTRLFEFVSGQVLSPVVRGRSYTVSVLSLLSKLVEVITTKLPVEFLSTILGADSMIPKMCYLYSRELSKSLIETYHCIMVLKSVPLLQEAYRLVLCQLEAAYNTLLKSEDAMTSDDPVVAECTLVSAGNPFSSVKYSVAQAEAVVIFDIRALVEIGNAKSNIIGMWALSPSVFLLFSQNLSPLNPIISECFPRVNFCVVEALYSHCCRHGHFILSSHLLSVSKESNLTSNSGHLSSILKLIKSLLTISTISSDCRHLALKWVLDLIEQLSPTKSVYSLKLFLQLLYAVIDCGFSSQKEITIAASSCLASFFTHSNSFDNLTIRSCVELCSIQLNSSNEDVQSSYLDLLKAFPLPVLQRLTSSSLCDGNEEGMLVSMYSGEPGDTFRKAYHHFMHADDGSTYSQMNFVHAINFLLDKNVTSRREFASDWVAKQYFSCQANEPDMPEPKIMKLVQSNSNLQWYWDVWQTAKFCVNSKLKTPLGNKTQDTFLAVENTLKYYASWPKSAFVGRTEGHNRQRMLKVKHLLFFMECLEKNVYNAIGGCAVALPQSPKAVRSFFRTNRATCREWMSRVRLPIILVAQETGQWAQVVRQAFEFLQDTKDGLPATAVLEKVLTCVVQALIELRAPNVLEGLNKWAKEVMPDKDFTWIASAVQVASGRIESSIVTMKSCYKSLTGKGGEGLLNGEAEEVPPRSSSGGQIVVDFIDKHVTEGYMKMASFKEAIKWKETVSYGCSSDKNFSIQQIKNVACFNSLDFKQFSNFSIGDGKEGDDFRAKSNEWRVSYHIKKADDIYMTAVKMLIEGDPKCIDLQPVKNWLLKSLSICEDVLCVTTEPKPVCINEQALILFNKSSLLLEQLNGNGKHLSWIWSSVDESLLKQCDGVNIASQLSVMHQCLTQQTVYNSLHQDKPIDLSNHLSSYRLAAIRHSRRHSNYNLCTKLLLDQMGLISSTSNENRRDDAVSTSDMLDSLANINGMDLFSYPNLIQSKMQIERQSAKLLYEQGDTSNAIKTFCNSISYSMEFMRSVSGTPQKVLSSLCELNARSLVTLVSWLQADSKLLSFFRQTHRSSSSSESCSPTGENFVQSFRNLLENGGTEAYQWSSVSDTDILSEMDILIKNLLNLSTTQCPLLAKSWFQLANWSYRWGRKAVDYANEDSFDLTKNEKFLLVQTMPSGCDAEQLEKVTRIISQVHKGGENVSEDDIADSNQMRSEDELDLVRRQLLSACPTLISHPDKIEALVNLWRTVVYRVYHHYKMSALSYFSFLKLNGTNSSDLKTDCNTTATLRLLRLLVKHSWGLRDVLEGGLAQSLTDPWKGIIPQLFSRLNHPEPYVRQSVTDLLCRVAKDTPHLIVYPAVVGNSSGKDLVREDGGKDGEGFWNEYFMKGNTLKDDSPLDVDIAEDLMSQEDDGCRDEVKFSTDVNSCFSQILDTLVKVNPRMVSEVQLLVSELHRITLLWDELWIGALGQTCQDLHKRVSHLETEVFKVIENKNLTEEERRAAIVKKHETILKPTIFLMEKLQEVTSQQPESAHEKWFQDAFKTRIASTIELLKKPINPRIPENSMTVFKQLLDDIQKKSHRHIHQQILEMKNISPALSSLTNTVIAMPGLSSNGQLVTISGISNIVQVLPTKTKPKKLVFIGSNGVRYPYLFKGLEDLHLDERIMQFLTIVNNMFSSSKCKDGTYRARHYSVTPLGARSGLIQWVDGAIPLFSLYKKWFQREALASQLKQMPNGVEAPQNVAIPSPSELYYNKLNPLLREKGISTHQRKEWPVPILRKVLKELMSETPKDLLSKELWCYSGTALDWWNVSQSYARSTAVMSMIGYVIGLGDRHLDNLLMDLSTGEVVHIDYNVCFEKGKSLRIPEKVPFRLTQNLQHALGLSGIEGTFRLSCEHVVKTMRQGKETLLTLLEAFVYDPLVDWTIGNEWCYTGAFYGGNHPLARSVASKQSRRELEKEVTVSMFSIKMTENKHEWVNNRDEMIYSVSKLEKVIAKACNIYKSVCSTEQQTSKLKQQMDYLKDALSSSKDHPIYSVQERFLSLSALEEAKHEMVKKIQKQLQEQSSLDELHKNTLNKLRSKWLTKLTHGLGGDCSLMDPVVSVENLVEFLQGAGQRSLVIQAEAAFADCNSAFMNHQFLMQEVMTVFHKYCNILNQLPFKSLEFHTERNIRRCSLLAEGLTLERMRNVNADVEKEVTEKIAKSEEAFQLLDILTKDYMESSKKYDLRVNERCLISTDDQVTLQSNYEMSVETIQKFLEEPSEGASEAMKSVLIFNLCNTAKQVNALEMTVHQSDIDVSSMATLDYLIAACNQAALLVQLSSYVQDDDRIKNMFRTMEALKVSLESARDLAYNFSTVIVPEAKLSLLVEDPSVQDVLDKLETISSEVGSSMDLITFKLENHASKYSRNLQTCDPEIASLVGSIRSRFKELFVANDNKVEGGDDLTRGKMLLTAMDGLFQKLFQDSSDLRSAPSLRDLPTSVVHESDIFRQAEQIKTLGVDVNSSNSNEMLQSLYFIQQYQATLNFLRMFQQSSSSSSSQLQSNFDGSQMPSDSECLNPVVSFLSKHVKQNILGLATQLVIYCANVLTEELLFDDTAINPGADMGTEIVNHCLANHMTTKEWMQHFHDYIFVTCDALRIYDHSRCLEFYIEMERTAMQNKHSQLVSLQWLHSDKFSYSDSRQDENADERQACPPESSIRSIMAAELQTALQNLTLHKVEHLQPTKARLLQVGKTINQRLKWTAGINLAVASTQQKFEELMTNNNSILEKLTVTSRDLIEEGRNLYNYEVLSIESSQSTKTRESLSALFEKARTICDRMENNEECLVEPVEKQLMSNEKLHTSRKIDSAWIEKSLAKLTGDLKSVTDAMCGDDDLSSIKDEMKNEVNKVRTVVSTHHRILSDMKTVLKSMAKHEDCRPTDGQDQPTELSVCSYLDFYKDFSHDFSCLLRDIYSAEISDLESSEKLLDSIPSFKVQIIRAYNDLMSLAMPLLSRKPAAVLKGKVDKKDLFAGFKKDEPDKSDFPTKMAAQPTKPTMAAPVRPDKIKRDPKTGKAIQERNSFAVGMWRRVKQKLEGKDIEGRGRLSIPEQVDYVIKEALNPDNLAVLYEGWTPWV